jgi:hypothetical protein
MGIEQSKNGVPYVQGVTGSNIADRGDNPIKSGAKYNSTLPTVASGNVIELQADSNGRLFIVGSDGTLQIVKIVDTAPVITATSAEDLIYNNTAIDYNVIGTKTIAPVSEQWLNNYGGGILQVKITSSDAEVAPAYVASLALIEIVTSQPTLTTPATDYVPIASASLAFGSKSATKVCWFLLPVGRFFLSINPIGASVPGTNKFLVYASLMSRGLPTV